MASHSLLRQASWQAVFLACLLCNVSMEARKFYDDDPLQQDPPPVNAQKLLSRQISDYYDFFENIAFKRGEYNTRTRIIRTKGLNTLGEVPDGAWYTNRDYWNPMSVEELVRGPGDQNAPSMDGPWVVLAPKAEGITPGFMIRDSKGRQYMLKFDPISNPEMATGADVISSKFFYALGYNVSENYLVYFPRSQLVLGKEVPTIERFGKRRSMKDHDITEMLLAVPRSKDGRYRAVASLWLEGTWLGPFRYYGTRKDDPNDTIPHEDRRDLRGLSVFCAWLDHDDSRAINTLDMLINVDGTQFVKHYLIDFGSTLGSGSTRPNSPRSGNEYLFAWKPAAAQFFSLGLYVPKWHRAYFPHLPAVGRFESKVFDPEKWVPEYRNAAFSNRLRDDAFWAAKQVMAFTDEQIHAIVKTGQYSNPEAENWIANCLIERRDKIGKAFFAKVLPLDHFAIRENQLVFEDLAIKYKLIASREYTVRWSRFDNETEQITPLPGHDGFQLPSEFQEAPVGNYFAADIHGGDNKKTVTVYLRKRTAGPKVVGIDRGW